MEYGMQWCIIVVNEDSFFFFVNWDIDCNKNVVIFFWQDLFSSHIIVATKLACGLIAIRGLFLATILLLQGMKQLFHFIKALFGRVNELFSPSHVKAK